MRLRILGCGTSSGVPRIGNDWGACDPTDPRNRRTRSALMVEGGGERWLVDCGPDLREQMLAAAVGDWDGVIVTHDHADHCHGIDDLRQVVQRRGRILPLVARPTTLARLQQRFAYVFEGRGLYPAVLDADPLEEGEDRQIAGARARFVDQPHGGITSLGIRFDTNAKSFAYSVDFHDMTEPMATLYAGLDLWVCDCLRRTPHPTHAHLDHVLRWARDLGVGQLLLTHLDSSMDYRTLSRELPDWAAPAHDGQEVDL